MYDEFGNYIGPELESDESEKEEEEEAEEEVSVWCAPNRTIAERAIAATAGLLACCREGARMGRVRRGWRWLRGGRKVRRWQSFFMKTRSTTPLQKRCMDQM